MRNLGDAGMVDARGGLTQPGKQFRGVLEIHLDEVAEAILWLASNAASYTTGTILSVTGGRALTP